MKNLLIFSLLFFVSLISSAQVLKVTDEKKYKSIVFDIKKKIKLKNIIDTLSSDFDNDGMKDYAFITDSEGEINKRDTIYRGNFIIYLSSKKHFYNYNHLMPCYDCNYIVFERQNVLENKIKDNPLTFFYIEKEDRSSVYFYYLFAFDKKSNRFRLNKKLRIIDECLSEEENFINKKKNLYLEDIDLNHDMNDEHPWYLDVPSKDCSNNDEAKIIVTKSTIYSIPNKPSKMYLLKNDEVEILEEKDEWLKIRFYGKKIIEGWIKKSDVEMN
ncbi:hypothetical protein [Emticicia sp. SJ17W-69]|uniref:hypothetical protein n=1 Tax=Emticicia sp. SJ17W-69 TaxID=3421657 RepID=UPI003EC08EE9